MKKKNPDLIELSVGFSSIFVKVAGGRHGKADWAGDY